MSKEMFHQEKMSGRTLLIPLAILAGSTILLFYMQTAPAAASLVAAIYPPWWSGRQAMSASAAAGAIVRFGAFPFVVVVAPREPGFAQTLRQSGAWFVVDPRFASGCGGHAGLDPS